MSKRIPEALNNYEQLSLLKQPNPRAPTGIRNLCIISLMLKLGLRVNEIINLKSDDINWEDGQIHIEESGAASERTLWLQEPELFLLRKWNRIKPKEPGYFFSTLDGNRLKDRYIREMVKRLARKAGITKDVHPHLLRYTFAVDLIKETGDINLLQESLGHRDLAATHAYAKNIFESSRRLYMSDFASRRSGTPVFIEHQQHIPLKENKIENHVRDNIHYKRSEAYQKNESGITNSSFSSDPDNNRCSYEGRTKDRKESQDLINTDKDDNTRALVKESKPVSEPKIKIESSETSGKSIKIPAIKCSSCNYILRFKTDCPKCGAKFNAIIEHWRRNI